jgi:hypothetical protein
MKIGKGKIIKFPILTFEKLRKYFDKILYVICAIGIQPLKNNMGEDQIRIFRGKTFSVLYDICNKFFHFGVKRIFG